MVLNCIQSQARHLEDYEHIIINNHEAESILKTAIKKYGSRYSPDEYMRNPVKGSEYVRLACMSLGDPGTLYLDTDVQVFGPLDIDEKRPGMEPTRTGMFNNGLIYNGDNPSVFDPLCEKVFQDQIRHIFDASGHFARHNNFASINGNYIHFQIGMNSGYRIYDPPRRLPNDISNLNQRNPL